MLLGGLVILGLVVFWVCGNGYSWVVSFGITGASLGHALVTVTIGEVSIVCSFMLLCCGGIAVYYVSHYMGSDAMGVSPLMLLVLWFISIMGGLVMSSNLLLSLIFWEYLGLVSYFLILYYANSVSLRASMVTLFASRFGDVAFFLLIMCVANWEDASASVMFLFFFLLVIMTKSACYPFISWLLEAMRAPTPVSSLVHSSTLVAAGVWFVLQYSYLSTDVCLSVLVFFAFISIFVSGGCALMFSDLKKIVALSTCNNVSWCLVFFVLGTPQIALLQLLCHGVCKCYLFMVVGDLMASSGGAQSSVGVYLSRYTGFYGCFVRCFLALSLAGCPFIGLFFSKHFFFSEVSYMMGWGSSLILLVCLFLTYAYSVRLILILGMGGCGLFCGYGSSFLLVSFLSLLGSVLGLCGVGGIVETCMAGSWWTYFMLSSQLCGVFVGYWGYVLYGEDSCYSGSNVFGSDSVVRWVISLVGSTSLFSLLPVYRWERSFLWVWPLIEEVFMHSRSSMLGFGFVIFSLGVLVFLTVLGGVV